jgi:hypothetical protein
VPNANLDVDLRKTVAEEYPTRQAFLGAVDAQLHKALSPYQAEPKIAPEALRTLLTTPPGEPVRDLASLIGQALADAQAKGIPLELAPLLEKLAFLPQLKGLNFLIVPFGLTGGRGMSSTGGTFWIMNPSAGRPGPNPGTGGSWVAQTFHGVSSTAFLRVFVVDLNAKQLLMEGRIGASASSAFQKAAALHELEEDLGVNLMKALLNPQ